MEQSSAFVDSAAMPEASGTYSMETLTGSPRTSHGLMDVLRPASPPRPKNPRIIRRFDLEAAKYDPQPEGAPPQQPIAAESVPEPRAAVQPTRTREEAKALRNRSLAAAARFL